MTAQEAIIELNCVNEKLPDVLAALERDGAQSAKWAADYVRLAGVNLRSAEKVLNDAEAIA